MSSLAWLPSTLAHALLSSALKIVKYTLFKCRVAAAAAAAAGGSGRQWRWRGRRRAYSKFLAL